MGNSIKKKSVGFSLLAVLLAAPMVARYEGTILQTYVDPVGVPTVCIGETDKEIVMRNKFTADECTVLLGASLLSHMTEVAECVVSPVKPHEAAAIVSWSYNVGTSAACASTLVRKLNSGAPSTEWCNELKRWVFAGGKKLEGLVNRREAEYKMCTTGKWQ